MNEVLLGVQVVVVTAAVVVVVLGGVVLASQLRLWSMRRKRP